MKWSVSTLAGLGVAVATASAMPVPDASTCTPDDVILQCATQTYNEVATVSCPCSHVCLDREKFR